MIWVSFDSKFYAEFKYLSEGSNEVMQGQNRDPFKSGPPVESWSKSEFYKEPIRYGYHLTPNFTLKSIHCVKGQTRPQ